MQCQGCQKTTDKTRLPPGWKSVGEQTYCPDCFRKRYKLRSIVLPVSGPLDKEDWPAFREALFASWGQATSLVNWAVTELAKHDVVRTANMEKLPPIKDVPGGGPFRLAPDKPQKATAGKGSPPVYLYGWAAKKFPDWGLWSGCTQSAQSLLRWAQVVYAKERYELIWLGSRTSARRRYPVPYPVHNAAWSLSWLSDDQKVPVLSASLGGRKWSLKLNAHNRWHQKRSLELLIAGQALQCECAIYRQRDNGQKGNGVKESTANGGGQKVHYRIMAKLVLWLPRQERQPGTKTMHLRTEKESFLVAEVDGWPPWVLNADHVRNWVARHRRYVHRMSEDLKYEKRWPKEMRQQMLDAQQRRINKHDRRMDNWTHEITAMVAALAERRSCGRVVYDDSERGYLGDFPAARIEILLQEKLEDLGIALDFASGEVVDETPGASRMEEVE